MIASIRGTVILQRASSIIVETAGIGYEVFVANPMTFALNETAFLYTFQQFREDDQCLFGFESNEEYELFCLLINVKGIGCRMAMNALKASSAQNILQAIEAEDVKALKALPGIGAKTAGQIILDLKGKTVSIPGKETKAAKTPANPHWENIKDALGALGYKENEIEQLNGLFDEDDMMDESAVLKKALQQLALRKRY